MVVPESSPNPHFFHSKNELSQSFRAFMPVAQNWSYLDHAAVGPLPTQAAEAIRDFSFQAETSGDFYWPSWSAASQSLRKLGAKLIDCSTDELALVPNTTFGINVVANGFPWEKTSNPNVVVLANEFSSNLLPWKLLQRRGVEVRCVPVESDDLVRYEEVRKCVDSNTQIVSFSWVNYLSGYRLDLGRMIDVVKSKNKRARVFVDAIQGLGVFPCSVRLLDNDYLAADGHKWMLGPEGSGFLYLKSDRIDELNPLMVGWGSIQGAHHFQTQSMELKRDASRFEGGSANHVGQIAFQKSLQLLTDFGCHLADNDSSGNVGFAEVVLSNTFELVERLLRIGAIVHRDLDKASRQNLFGSGIVLFEIPEIDPYALRNWLVDNKIMLSVRHGKLRAAVHVYNDVSDFDKLIEAINSFTKRK